jgi:DNA-binding transcriptional ArsR family regulator
MINFFKPLKFIQMTKQIQMMKKLTNTHTFTIKDLDTLKVIADPLRWQIVELLVMQTMTVRQLAEKLGLATSKLYYHINTLEEHGLIQVVDTRIVSGIIEKHYRTTATDIDIEPSLLSFTSPAGRENIHSVLLSTLDATREDLLRSLQARAFELDHGAPEQPRAMVLNRLTSRISEERADEFRERLKSLLVEFGESDTEGTYQTYAMTVAFYPAFYYQKTDSEEV